MRDRSTRPLPPRRSPPRSDPARRPDRRMAPRIEGSTRVYAVLGHPVAHSLSPRMQSAAFEAAGMDAICVALDVPPERLEEALRGLHAAGVAGLSVTLPL